MKFWRRGKLYCHGEESLTELEKKNYSFWVVADMVFGFMFP